MGSSHYPVCPQTSNNIIQKGLAFVCERSGSVTVPGTKRALGSCPAGRMAEVGLRWWRRQMTPHQRKGDPDGYKTQLLRRQALARLPTGPKSKHLQSKSS